MFVCVATPKLGFISGSDLLSMLQHKPHLGVTAHTNILCTHKVRALFLGRMKNICEFLQWEAFLFEMLPPGMNFTSTKKKSLL